VGEIVEYPSPYGEEKKTAYLGMLIFIAGWTMMFGVLFFIYGALRIAAESWPPLGLPLLPIVLPTLNTVVMLASSASFEWGLLEIRRGRPGRLAAGLAASAVLGVVFCAIQWKSGADLVALGLTFDRGAYAAVFFGFAMIHAAHVIVGVLALGYLGVRAAMGAYTTPRHLTPRLWAIYWHFVLVVWLAIYFLIILL
jgi:cytochrome c oxidase subunit 3